MALRKKVLAAILLLTLSASLGSAQTNFWWTNSTDAAWNTLTGIWTNNAPTETPPGSGGSSNYTITFQNSLAINSTNDLGTPNLLLNRLNFTGSGVTLWGSNLNFIANGAVLPQFLQNSTGAITVNTGLILSNNLTFAGASNNAVTVNGAISGSGGVILNGPYTLALTNANTYSGSTTVSNGTLFIRADNNLGAAGAALILAGGTLRATNNFTLNNRIITLGTGTNTFTMDGASTLTVTNTPTVSGGTWLKTGSGTLTFSGAINWAANGIISNGTVSVGSINNDGFGVNSGTITVASGGVLIENTANKFADVIVTVNNGGLYNAPVADSIGIINSADSGGVVTNGGGFTFRTVTGTYTWSGSMLGAGGVTLQAPNWVLTGTNAYTGGTTITGGSLILANTLALTNSTITVSKDNGLLFSNNVATFIIGGLAGANQLGLTNSAGGIGLTVGGNNATTTFSGAMTGSGSLTKAGTGTLILAGTNTFAGGINLQNGGLLFSTTSAIPSTVTSLLVPFGASAGVGYPLAQAFLNIISNQSAGTVALGGNSANNLDFTSLTNVSLGAINGTWTYTGTLTPANDTYRLGGGGGNLILTNDLALVDSSGPRSLVVGGSLGGTVTLNGSNTFTGGTTLTTNTLSIASENNIGGPVAAFTINGGTLQVRGTALTNLNLTANLTTPTAFDIVYAGNTFTVATNITAAAPLTKAGLGTLALANSNAITGAVTVNAGVLSLQHGNALGPSPGVVVASGATLQLTNGLTYAAIPVILNGAGFAGGGALRSVSDGNTYLGTITNTAGSRLNSDVGTLTLSNVVLSAAGSYFGGAGNIRVVGNLSGGVDVYKDGTGTLTFQTANSDNSNWWTVYAGTLAADFTAVGAPTNNIIGQGGKGIRLSGGTLLLIGKPGLTNSQTFAGNYLNLLAGNSAVVISNSVILTINNSGTLNRSTGAMIDFIIPSAPGRINTSTGTNTAGIVGGWATIAGSDWATVLGGIITNYFNYNVVSAGGSITSNVLSNVKLDSTTNDSIGLGAPVTVINSLLSSSGNAITVTNNGATLRLGVGANGGIFLPKTSGGLTIGTNANDGYLSAGGPTATAGELILINNSASDLTVNSAIINNSPSNVAVTVTGPGSTVLNGTNNFGGILYANTGTLTINGNTNLIGGGVIVHSARVTFNGASSLGAGNLIVGNVASDRGVAVIATNMVATKIQVGLTDNARSVGAIFQTGGAITLTGGSPGLSLGEGTGDYGYYNLSGGSLSASDFYLGTKGCGVFEMTGGTINLNNAIFVGRGGAVGAAGVLNVFGGTIVGSTNNNNYITMGGSANNSYGLLNVANGGVINIAAGTGNNRGLGMMYADNNTNVINLLPGGTIIANKVYVEKSTGQSIFNFNGGTLTTTNVNATGGTFMTGLTAAFVYQGGAIIDTTNISLTVAQNLLAPTGYGITNIQIAGQGGGYLGAPAVVITGGQGAGASAIAEMNLTSGIVTNIRIINPGSGYLTNDAVTVQLVGGGFTNSALLGTIDFAANTSAGGLTKLGTGTLILTGTNTYSGGTVVNNGTLQLGAGGAAGSVTSTDIAVSNGAWIAFNRSGLFTNTALIAGAGGVVQNGTGTLVFASANAYTGPTWMNGGTLSVDTINDNGPSQIGTNSLLGFNGGAFRYTGPSVATSRNVTNPGAATFDIVNSGATLTLDGNISGLGALNKTGPGMLTLTATNTYTGNTTITAGTLTIGGAGVLGGGNYSATIINTGRFVYASSANQALIGNISGTGALIKNNSSTLTLYGNNTYSGGTTISQGTLQIVRPIDPAANPLGTGLVTLDGGTLQVSGQLVVLTSTRQPLTMTGWNRDFIWANSEATATGGTSYVLNNWVYYEKNAARNGGLNGMPTSRIITSALNSAVAFQIEPYDNLNTLLTTATATTLTLANPTNFLSLSLLGASGNAVPTITYSLNFADGSTTTGTFQPRDWVGPNAITSSLAAQSTSGGSYYTNAGLNQTDIFLSTPDQAKALNSITFQVTANGGGGSWIMGVNGNAGTTAFGATQSYANAINVTADSTVDVRNSLAASFGPLSIGSRTLTITGDSGAGVAFGTTTLTGNPIFNTVAGTTLNLKTVGDGGTGYGLTKTGPGTLILSGSCTYTGATTISQGTLRLNGVTTTLGNIMPTGDSITYGSGDSAAEAGYRGYLYNLLTNGGYTFQYVGSQTGNPGSLPTTPVDQTHHEGHSGWTVAQVLTGVTAVAQGGLGWLNVNPDIITLMIGTNNRGSTNNVPGAITQLGQIIDTVSSNRPGARLFVAEITPIPGQEAFVSLYNSNVIALVSAKQAAGANIFLVDLNTNYPTNSLPDNLHPNDNGYNWMAQQWYSAIAANVGNVSSNVLSSATTVAIASGATLDLSGVNQTIASLSDSAGGGGTITNSAGTTPLTLTINPSAGSTTFSGTISDDGASNAISLVKSGAGTQVLSGTNTYSGDTTINAGTLAINGQLLGSAVTVSAGTLGGTGTLGNVTINNGGTLSPGNSIGTLTVSNLTLAGTLAIELSNDSVDVINVLSNLTLNSALLSFDVTGTQTSNAYVFAYYGGVLSTNAVTASGLPSGWFVNYDYAPQQIAVVVPEPGTGTLVGMGLLAMLWLCRRRRYRP